MYVRAFVYGYTVCVVYVYVTVHHLKNCVVCVSWSNDSLRRVRVLNGGQFLKSVPN